MAVRRINYTGRKRLRQNDAQVFLQQVEGVAEFTAFLSLAKYDLPSEALVSVEVQREMSLMRFPFGTVGNITPAEDRKLREFSSPDGVLFRVKVTSVGSPQGLLLAEADGIRPRRWEDAEDERISLLPAIPDDDLGDQVFRVDFSDRPYLHINSRSGDWKSLARDPVFVSLAYPAIMRETLVRILYAERYFDTEDSADWRSQWLRFALTLPGVPDAPADGEEDRRIIDDWIDHAVSGLCRRFGMYKRFSSHYWTMEAAI